MYEDKEVERQEQDFYLAMAARIICGLIAGFVMTYGTILVYRAMNIWAACHGMPNALS